MKTKHNMLQEVDLLLHPRGPPLVRPLPHVEALSLFRAEESNEELTARTSLSLTTTYDANVMDVEADPIMMTPSLPEPTPQSVPMHLTMPTPRTTAPAPPIVLASRQQTSSITAAPTKNSADAPPAISIQQLADSPPSASRKTTPVTVKPTLIPVAVDDEEEEPMPTIDTESDSDG
jgi:hypothetical protein